MQSAIIMASMILMSLFIGAEYMRTSSTDTNTYQPFKAETTAYNILQYHDLMLQYMLDKYDVLHLVQSLNPGTAEQINLLDYQLNQVSKYTQTNLTLFLNYQSVAFNYTNASASESEPMPVLYIASSFDSYTSEVHGYSGVQLQEVMGKLGQLMAKHLYQGNSTYWVMPWVFSQDNCNIIEVYSPIPNGENGISNIPNLKVLFNSLCTQIETKSSYKFLTYVYMEPVINPPNI